MRKNEEEQGTRLVRLAAHILLGGAVAMVVCVLFLLLASFGMAKGWLEEGLMYRLTIVGCVLGGFVGGGMAVRRIGSRPLVVGLLVGAVFFLLLLTAGLLFFRSVAPEEGGLGLLCGALCGGAAAGLFRGKPKKKRRK